MMAFGLSAMSGVRLPPVQHHVRPAGVFLRMQGDEANGKRYLFMGAVSGCTGCIREENSLRGLVLMLFDEGDYERAYRHLNASIGNANSYGAWLRNIRASTLQPIILPCTM